MLASFTTLAYAFCAAVLPAGATEIVALGYFSLDRCFVLVETGEAPSSESMLCGFLFRKRRPFD
jgi:hypothetical protein